MKILKYQFVCREINHGTDENPDIEQVIDENTVQCPDDLLEANLAIYREYAINGEVRVEDIPDEPQEPTQLDRIEAQTTYTAMMTDTLLEV